ncbi:MAG: LacI family DNA-binding transcriptional regulator [Sphingomonadales bacterium]|nr:LacI family DNA-binding transcriptional regulator [Sphingomonadales bacterium]
MPTMRDVARHAGVSMKSVSRVLNGEAHVRPQLRERVMAAVQALDYSPNLAARQLAGHRSFIIAYPFNNPSAAYITDILMGAARTCRDRGYHLVSEPVELDDQMLPVIERLVTTLRPDGMMLTPPLCDMPSVVEHVARFGVPLVRIAGGLDLYGRSIVIDDRSISRAMVAHLVEQGHRRIGFVQPHPDHALAQRRFDGYLDGLEEAGIEPEPALIRPGFFDIDSGIRAAEALLDLPHPPTAIFASNDDMALGAIQVAHNRRLSVPGNLAIAGFDDSTASRLAYPALTTVRQPTQLLGAVAATLLLGGELDPGAIRHELLIRASTAAFSE